MWGSLRSTCDETLKVEEPSEVSASVSSQRRAGHGVLSVADLRQVPTFDVNAGQGGGSSAESARKALSLLAEWCETTTKASACVAVFAGSHSFSLFEPTLKKNIPQLCTSVSAIRHIFSPKN